METQLHRPHHHHEEDHGQNPGLPSVMEGEGEGEQQHEEKKSVLKKVKDKAKKIKNTIKKHGHYRDNEDDQNDDRHLLNHPQPHGAPMYESSGVRRRDIGKESITNLENPRDKRETSLGPMGFVEDHHSPNADFPSRPAAHLVPQFNNLNVDEKRPYNASHDQITTTKTEANPVGQPETRELNPKAHDSADTESTVVASKLGYSGDQGQECHDSSSKKPISEYAHKVAETLAPVYNKVVGASMKEYLSEKFRPGEEDRELSKVITNALGNKKETKQVVGKVTMSEEVAARLGDAEKDVMESGQQTVVDRLRDAILLWLGKSNGIHTAHHSVATSYAQFITTLIL